MTKILESRGANVPSSIRFSLALAILTGCERITNAAAVANLAGGRGISPRPATESSLSADRLDRAARSDRTDRYPARLKRGSAALMRCCGSGYRKLGKQSLAFGLGAEQQRD